MDLALESVFEVADITGDEIKSLIDLYHDNFWLYELKYNAAIEIKNRELTA